MNDKQYNYQGEVGLVWKTPYAVINIDGVDSCAWCKKPVEEIPDFDKHINLHEMEEKS